MLRPLPIYFRHFPQFYVISHIFLPLVKYLSHFPHRYVNPHIYTFFVKFLSHFQNRKAFSKILKPFHTFTICVICARGRASPSSTVRQRTPPLGSLYPSDKCELPVPRLRTALQVQDRPAEPLPYPQIRGTDNVILETEGPP